MCVDFDDDAATADDNNNNNIIRYKILLDHLTNLSTHLYCISASWTCVDVCFRVDYFLFF